MTVEKPKPKQLLRPITTGPGSTMNQSQFLAITCNSFEAPERSRVYGAIGLGFASHWLKNWRESFNLITKRSNRNHVLTFDSLLKNALIHACDVGCVHCAFLNVTILQQTLKRRVLILSWLAYVRERKEAKLRINQKIINYDSR